MLKQKQERLKQLETLNLLHETTKEIQELRKEINECLTREEVMWNQRSRAIWLKHGDLNTKFFHATPTQRQRKNRIDGLRGSNGRWHEEQEEIEQMILDYFVEVYSSEQPCNHEVKVEGVTTRITAEMNSKMLEKFREDEVRKALNQMHPTKALGPNGMPLIFLSKVRGCCG